MFRKILRMERNELMHERKQINECIQECQLLERRAFIELINADDWYSTIQTKVYFNDMYWNARMTIAKYQRRKKEIDEKIILIQKLLLKY